MHLDQLRNSLASLDYARTLLQSWSPARPPNAAGAIWTHLAASLSLDALKELCTPLTRFLPRCPDADMALNNLERFPRQPRSCRPVEHAL